MRTVPFRTVLEQVLALSGTPYSASTQEQREIAANHITLRFQEGYDRYPWPEILKIEERAFAAAYDAGRTYDSGDVVWYSTTSKYYEATATGTGNLPTNTSFWEETTKPAALLIEYEQYGANKIYRLWGAYERDPRVNTTNRSRNYVQTADGFVFPGSTTNTLWLVFTTRPPVWTAIPYNASASYARYDQVFSTDTENANIFPDRGENWIMELDDDENAFWLKQDFPAVLQLFVSYGAAADLMLYGGNRDVADIQRMKAQADTALWDEWDKVKPLATALVKGLGA